MSLGGLLLGAAFFERNYAGRVYPGVQVLGVSMEGKTYQEARMMIAARADALLSVPIELVYTDGTSEVFTPDELGLELDTDALATAAYVRGRTGNFINRLSETLLLQFSGAAYAFTPNFDADRALLTLEESLVAHERDPKNATLIEQNGELLIVPEERGSRIDRAKLSGTLETAFDKLDFPGRIDILTEIVEPTVTAADLAPILSEAQRLTGVPLTVRARETNLTISSTVLAGWIGADTAALPVTLTWNSEKITSYLGTLARKIDLPMQPKKINIQNGSVITEGRTGYQLDRTVALQAILKELQARTSLPSLTAIPRTIVALAVKEVPIEEARITPPFTPGLYEGKYVEVNLTDQTLYQWEGTTMIASYPVSTGKWSTPTPQGVMYIKNHISYAYSRAYDLYMPWWLGLAKNPDGSGYEGYGIHELPEWKGGLKEGQSHLGTPVSHGCVRLGVGPANAIYAWAEEGMPVYIHK